MVQEFLRKATLKAPYTFAIATYGKLSGNPFKFISHEFNYTNHLLMVDNFIDHFEIETEQAKLPQKQIDIKLQSIIDDVTSHKEYQMPVTFGMKFTTKICEPLFNKMHYT